MGHNSFCLIFTLFVCIEVTSGLLNNEPNADPNNNGHDKSDCHPCSRRSLFFFCTTVVIGFIMMILELAFCLFVHIPVFLWILMHFLILFDFPQNFCSFLCGSLDSIRYRSLCEDCVSALCHYNPELLSGVRALPIARDSPKILIVMSHDLHSKMYADNYTHALTLSARQNFPDITKVQPTDEVFGEYREYHV